MAFFSRNPQVQTAIDALNDHHDSNKKALKAGDPAVTAENDRLQDELIAAERAAKKA